MTSTQDVLDLSLSSVMMASSLQSFTLSKRFTKILMKSSVLNILYQRMVVNNGDLKTKQIEGVSFMVFKRKNPKDPLLRHYLDWVKGIVDAIEKNYLKEVILLMKNPNDEEPIEAYRFVLKYNIEGNAEHKHTTREVQSATLNFLQAINMLGKNGKLSEHTEVEVELKYFSETPNEYEPPGFHPSLNYYSKQSMPFHLGTVKTEFHKLTCYGEGDVFNKVTPQVQVNLRNKEDKGADANEEASITAVEVIKVPPVQESIDVVRSCNQKSSVLINLDDTIILVDKDQDVVEEEEMDVGDSAVTPKIKEKAVVSRRKVTLSDITISVNSDKNSFESDRSVEMTEERFTCICHLDLPADMDIIQCIRCMKQYHLACHGFLSKEEALGSRFTCIECSRNDIVMSNISIDERLLFCRLRLILYYIYKRGQMPTDILNIFSRKHRDNVMEKLRCFNILNKENKSKINQTALSRIISNFFSQYDSQIF